MPIDVNSYSARLLVVAIAAQKPKPESKIAILMLRELWSKGGLTSRLFVNAVEELQSNGYVDMSPDKTKLIIHTKFIEALKN